MNHVLDGRLVFPRQTLIYGSHVISVEMHSKYKKNVGALLDYSKPILNQLFRR